VVELVDAEVETFQQKHGTLAGVASLLPPALVFRGVRAIVEEATDSPGRQVVEGGAAIMPRPTLLSSSMKFRSMTADTGSRG
jgi:hypothetical protein